MFRVDDPLCFSSSFQRAIAIPINYGIGRLLSLFDSIEEAPEEQGQMGEDILFLSHYYHHFLPFFSFFFWLQAEMKDFCGLYRYPPEFVVILVVVGVVAAAAAAAAVVVVVVA